MNATVRSATVRVALAVYHTVASVLPRDFRHGYAHELDDTFERLAVDARARGRFAVVAVTLRSLVDLMTRAPREHRAAARRVETRRTPLWVGAGQDLRYGLRRLIRRPAFSLGALVTLGLGIGAVTAVFTLVHGVVLNPLPYPESDRIVRIDHGAAGMGIDRGLGVTFGFYRFYAEHLHTTQAMAMYQSEDLTLTGTGDPVRLNGARVTPSLESVLETAPLRGRWFTPDEAAGNGARVVVLSARLWRDRFGGDAGVLDRTVELEGRLYTVVGIMPASWAFPSPKALFWTPLPVPATGIGGWNFQAVARLAPDVGPDDLAREIRSLFPLLRQTTDDPARVRSYLDEARVTPRILPLKDDLVGDIRSTLWILLGTVGVVLIIAIANVANLFLVRSEDTQRETAVRAALGASRGRLVRGFLGEGLLLATAAGGLGVGAAVAAVGLLRARAPIDIPRLAEVHVGAADIGAAGIVAAVAALAVGLAGVFRRSRDLSGPLKEGGQRTTAGRRSLKVRETLVVIQVALALVLLIGSGLLVRTFGALRSVDPGFRQRQALTFTAGIPGSRYPNRAAQIDFQNRLLDRLRVLPGVTSAAAVGQCLPLSGNLCWGDTLEADGEPTPEGQVPPVTGVRVTSAGYFETMGIPIRGRTFTRADETSGQAPVVLSEAAARGYFPDRDALGGRIRFSSDSPWLTIVGIAGNVRARIESDDLERLIYLPLRSDLDSGPPPATMAFVVASGVPPASLAATVRRAVAELDPAVPLAGVQSLADLIAKAIAPTAFALALIGVAAGIALVLGVVGVYAVVAYAVSRRRNEFGLRLALGARPGDIQRLVMGGGGRLVLVGVALGLVGALLLTHLMTGLLFGVSRTDPASYTGITALLLAAAALALYLPARQASRVDPTDALRSGT